MKAQTVNTTLQKLVKTLRDSDLNISLPPIPKHQQLHTHKPNHKITRRSFHNKLTSSSSTTTSLLRTKVASNLHASTSTTQIKNPPYQSNNNKLKSSSFTTTSSLQTKISSTFPNDFNWVGTRIKKTTTLLFSHLVPKH